MTDWPTAFEHSVIALCFAAVVIAICFAYVGRNG
jgi:hypothetical protein